MNENDFPPAPSYEFSIFDWLDESGRGFAQDYDDRLELLALADEKGFYAYHLAEHHGSQLSQTPSPTVFLSALAQRTQRLRFGALTYVLPVYNPIRLLEELCMLDQLSHGRLELGIGAGASPHERQRFGVTPDEAHDRYQEMLQILIQGFTTGAIDFHGRFYEYDGLRTRFRPYQQPYPPLWYPTSNRQSVPYLAAQGFNFVLSPRQWPNFDDVVALMDVYRREWVAHRDDPGRLNAHVARPFLGLSMHVHVAETDAKARDQARPAYVRFYDNYTRRYVDLGQTGRYPPTVDFDKMVDDEHALCGSPETVRRVLSGLFERSGADYLVGTFMFGDLPPEQARRSIELFAAEVMPAFQGKAVGSRE
jgi:alkanesulfonate monooxygenase SsuD/methylene tetrahydromethanopterin reductase-like flavin-dependent oxidoreductase (luciferase family)